VLGATVEALIIHPLELRLVHKVSFTEISHILNLNYDDSMLIDEDLWNL
jgi:hypothetical protein